MKRLLTAVALVLFLCLPVQAGIYSWIWADSDAIGVRVGTDVAENVEVGLSTLWLPDQEKPEFWGVYAIYHLPECVKFSNPIVLDFLPETIRGCPYFGGKVDMDFNLNRSKISPIAGIVFADVIFVEYQFESIDRTAINESKIIFGLRIKF